MATVSINNLLGWGVRDGEWGWGEGKKRREVLSYFHDILQVADEAGTAQKTVATVSGANNIAWLGSKDKELLLCSCDDGTLQVS